MSWTEVTGTDPASGKGISVRVEHGVVTAIQRTDGHDEAWLTAGFVDLQVNGFAGFDANAEDVDADQIIALVRASWSHGVTTVVPTLITAAEDQLLSGLRAVAAARKADPLVAHAVPYVHVEGPHLSAEDGPRGVHPTEHIRPPEIDEFDRWQRAGDGLVGMVTISPHFESAPNYVAALVHRGVNVSLGHTHATPEQITAAVDAGATLSTHLGNGAHPVIRRHPNYIWAQLAEDRLSAGFIADGHHLPADTLVAMLRAKGLDRSFLVSDATALAGMAPGRYTTPVGGEVELSADGRLSYVGTPMLAGAARSVAVGVAHVANLGPFSPAEAVGLATISPGRFCGGRGQVRVGAPADLVRFTWAPGEAELSIDTVLVNGRVVVPTN